MSRLIVSSLALLTLAGCLTRGEVEPIRRYAVEPVISVETLPPTASTVGVRPLEAARPYREAIVFLGEGQEMGRRLRAEWAERPREVLTRAVTDALIATQRFADVGDAANMVRPDYILTGEVRQFRENHTVTPWQAEVEVRLALRESRGVEQMWAATIRASAPLEDESASGAARALAVAVADAAVEAAQGIATAIP